MRPYTNRIYIVVLREPEERAKEPRTSWRISEMDIWFDHAGSLTIDVESGKRAALARLLVTRENQDTLRSGYGIELSQ